MLTRTGIWNIGALGVLLTVSGAHAFTITPFYPDAASWTAPEMAVVQQAITDWTSDLAFNGANHQDIPIGFSFISAGTSYIAQWQGALVDPGHSQYPYSG